jgi:2-polyprenyl-3-methyl-5-hydroxy-6-metoxy-1,4-benzoquinol methylase
VNRAPARSTSSPRLDPRELHGSRSGEPCRSRRKDTGYASPRTDSLHTRIGPANLRAIRRLKRVLRRVGWHFVDRRLAREQRRGVLGPAHRRWRDNSAMANRDRWSLWDWSGGGEEWNASPEWKEALVEHVLLRWIPQDQVVLEIGAGAGRWSAVLHPRAWSLILVDVTERPLALCRERFAEAQNVEYVLSSGNKLSDIANSSVDAIWSFDVFVHVRPVDQAAYLAEVARVLTPGGVAVIHHADGRNLGDLPSRNGSGGRRCPGICSRASPANVG